MIKRRISFFLFVVILFLTAFQFSSFGIIDKFYFGLRTVIIIGFFLLFLTTYTNPLTYFDKISVFKIHTVCLVLLFVVSFVLYSFGLNVNFSTIRNLGVSWLVLMIGLNMNLNIKQTKFLIAIFILFYALSAVSIVFTFASGFVIHEQYLPIPKNQLAPVFGTAFILSLYFAIKQKGLIKWIYYFLSFLLFSSLLVIRGRAVIVSVLITSIVFMLFYIKSKKTNLLIILFILIIIPFIGEFIYDALFLNRDITDLDSFSSGRMVRNVMGIEFFLNYPIMGGLLNKFSGGWIHNYILLNLVDFGAVLGSFVLIVYFKYLSTIVVSIKNNSFQYLEVAPLLMLILWIVSSFEPSYPYSPGSAIFFPFFLMGQYLKINNKYNNG